eukprot:CAMPEP_0205930680 /NCGR_PEP_ID=MMETSP1325-20131115/26038_1 /ASSEMBLY_ACC=CAM_ASM_000708 /TAXON_ID=236786 /ORGANISM="Florenciella sp., Strain RCC1007" /LENGTH=36 /DNA_ID= /DNA_START= /DNA_END= /DNA_ORIENTATION=
MSIPTTLAYILITSSIPLVIIGVVWAVYALRIKFAK